MERQIAVARTEGNHPITEKRTNESKGRRSIREKQRGTVKPMGDFPRLPSR